MAQTTRIRARMCLLGVSLTFKVSCYRNYFIDFNEILHNDRDHQELVMGGPNRRPTNPRWRTAAVLKQEAQLSLSDRAMHLVSSKLANYHATVQKLLIRQVLTNRWYDVGGLVGGNVS